MCTVHTQLLDSLVWQEGRTPLHYTVLCRDEAGAAKLLEGAGAVRAVRDAAGRTPAHYRGTARELLVLPDTAMARDNKNTPGQYINTLISLFI